MNLIYNLEFWVNANCSKVLNLVRIGLGTYLLLQGVAFVDNTAYLKSIFESQDIIKLSQSWLSLLIQYVTYAHIIGGILIIFGLITRIGCGIIIPIVAGAIFLTEIFRKPIDTLTLPSVIAFVLLIIFILVGSGRISIDNVLKNRKRTKIYSE